MTDAAAGVTEQQQGQAGRRLCDYGFGSVLRDLGDVTSRPPTPEETAAYAARSRSAEWSWLYAAAAAPDPLGAGFTAPAPELPKRIPPADRPADVTKGSEAGSPAPEVVLVPAVTAGDDQPDSNGPESASPQADDSGPEDGTGDKNAAADQAEAEAKAYLARVAPGVTFDSQPGDAHTDTALTRIAEAHEQLDAAETEGQESTEGGGEK